MPYHHFVSAFHLAQFTPDPQRGRKAMVYALNLQRRARHRTAVQRAGGEGGYNTVVSVPGLGPAEMEKLFERRYETPTAPVLRAVNETVQLPEGEALERLLAYFAFIALNNPARREGMQDAQTHGLGFMAQMMVADPETFEAAQAEHRRNGVPVLGEIGYDKLRVALEDGSFTYNMPTIAHLQGLGHAVDQLAALLRQRVWSLLVATRDVPDFVCGDHPVTISWTVQRAQEFAAAGVQSPPSLPGFSLDGTELLVPLGRRVALVGVFGGVARRLAAVTAIVAEANRRAAAGATAFVYSAEPTFTFSDVNRQLHNSSELLDEEQG